MARDVTARDNGSSMLSDAAQKLVREHTERMVPEMLRDRVFSLKDELFQEFLDKLNSEELYNELAARVTRAVARVNHFGGMAQVGRLDSSAIDFLQSGTGATARTVQEALRAITRSGDYATAGNFDTATAALTETIGIAALNASPTGVYTNTQMNQIATFLLNGLDPETEFQAEQGANYATEALTAGIDIPSSATVYQANAVAGYVNNDSTTTNAVAGYFSGRSGASSVDIWGINAIVQDTAGQTSVSMIGIEVDINANNVGTSGAGITVTGSFSAQPTSFEAITIGKPGSNQFTAGLTVKAGAVSGNAAVDIYQQTTGSSQSSQLLMFHGKDSGGTDRLAYINADLNGALVLTPLTGQLVSVVGGLTASAQIQANAIRATSTRTADNASSAFLEFSSGGRILVEGASAATLAPFSIVLADSAGGNAITPLSIATTGVVTIPNLAGVGSRTVVADANGVLSAP